MDIMSSKIEPATMERLLQQLHGQSAKILHYLALHGKANPNEVSVDLALPRSCVYKTVRDLIGTRLVSAHQGVKTGERGRVGSEVLTTDFRIVVENLPGVPRLEITPKNVAVFDLLGKSSGKLFVERHGMGKFARFMGLYEDYANGKMPAFMIAKELDAERFEVELLIGDTEGLTRPMKRSVKKWDRRIQQRKLHKLGSLTAV